MAYQQPLYGYPGFIDNKITHLAVHLFYGCHGYFPVIRQPYRISQPTFHPRT